MGQFQLNFPQPYSSGSDPAGTSVEKVFWQSENEAEYTIGWVRITVGLALFVGGFLISSDTAALARGYGISQLRATALMTVAAFLFLGITSFLPVITRRFRPWMAFALVTGDAAIVGASLYYSLDAISLAGNWVVAIPTIWAVPLLLAVGALRYRPLVQLWATLATMIGVVGVAAALGFRSTGATSLATLGEWGEHVDSLLSLPPTSCGLRC